MLNIKEILDNMNLGSEMGFDASKILAMVELNLKYLIGEINLKEIEFLEEKTIKKYKHLDK